MTLPNTMSFGVILFVMARFLWLVWPLLLAIPLQGRNAYLAQMLPLWVFCAILRLAVAFDPKPLLPISIVPEPLYTIVFLLTGAVLLLLKFSASNLLRGRVR